MKKDHMDFPFFGNGIHAKAESICLYIAVCPSRFILQLLSRRDPGQNIF